MQIVEFVLSRSIWVSINVMDKLLSTYQTLGAKTHKKYCHVRIFEGIGLWLLAFNVKLQRTNFCS
jgi:hypothetical protein